MTSDFITELAEQLGALLTEQTGVAARKVNDAINNKYRVQIRYNDNLKKRKRGQKGYKRGTAPTGIRLIEPYALGISKAGNKVLRGFQYSGATRRGVPKWKMFRLDRIIDWKPIPNSHFYVDPSYLNHSSDIKYNTEGDGSMISIINQVHFNNEPLDRVEDNNEWESPLDRIRRQMGVNKNNVEKQRTRVLPPESSDTSDSYEPKSLDKALSNQKTSQFNNDLDNALGINNNRYDLDKLSSQERKDREINRRRDSRWQNAADTRRLWRKGSANDDLMNAYDDVITNTDDKFGEDYYDDTYDDLYEPDNYRRK